MTFAKFDLGKGRKGMMNQSDSAFLFVQLPESWQVARELLGVAEPLLEKKLHPTLIVSATQEYPRHYAISQQSVPSYKVWVHEGARGCTDSSERAVVCSSRHLKTLQIPS